MDIQYTILIVFLVNFLLGLFVWLRNKTKLLNILSALVAFILAFWALSMFFYAKPLVFNSEIWIKIVYFFVLIMTISWAYFFKVFLNLKKFLIPNLISFISFVFIIILFFTDLWIKGVIQKEWGPETILGPIYFLVGVFILLCIIWVFYYWLKRYRIARGIKKMQLLYVFIGMFIFSVLATIFDIIIPIFTGNSRFFWVSPFFSLFFVGANVYAIAKYRLMDIRVVASKIYSNLFLAFFFFVSFYSVYYITDIYLRNTSFLFLISFELVLAFIFIFILFPILEYIQKTSDNIFFKGLNFEKKIKNISFELNQFTELNNVYKILIKNIKDFIAVKSVSFLIFSNIDNNNIEISKKKSFNYLSLSKKNNIIKKIKEERTILIYDEVKDENIKKEMSDLKVSVIVPLVIEGKILGLMILGEKNNDKVYGSRDIDLLEIISVQSAMSIYNALLYREVDNLNNNLKKEVYQQTRELKDRTDYLKKLLKTRSEFLDIAAHQLRTPATVIKGSLSMIVDGAVKSSSQKEEFLSVCFKKSIKLAEIINDILRASELDNENFTIELKPVDLQNILKKVYDNKKIQKQRDGDTEIDLELPSQKLPPIMSEERYLEQILENLLNNATQYTLEGFVKIKVSLSKNKKKIIIKIIDSGIGIPEKDQDKIFQKFFRAENALEIFTDGSGLGLFVVKRAMDLHPGAKVYLEKSVVNRGSTFVLEFPVISKTKK